MRYSLLIVLVVMGAWGLVHYLLGASALRDDLARSADARREAELPMRSATSA